MAEGEGDAGVFRGLGHSHYFMMDGYTQITSSGAFVPIYSDPEFDEFR